MIKLTKNRIKNTNNEFYISFWFNDRLLSLFISKLINHIILSYDKLTVDIYENKIEINQHKMEA